MNEVEAKIIESLQKDSLTEAQLAHKLKIGFRTVKKYNQDLIRENKIYISGFKTYANGRVKSIYSYGRPPLGLLTRRPRSNTSLDHAKDKETILELLPATISDLYSYFDWKVEYVQFLLDELCYDSVVEKQTSNRKIAGGDCLYSIRTTPKEPIKWEGYNVVNNPVIRDGVAIHTTWRF